MRMRYCHKKCQQSYAERYLLFRINFQRFYWDSLNAFARERSLRDIIAMYCVYGSVFIRGIEGRYTHTYIYRRRHHRHSSRQLTRSRFAFPNCITHTALNTCTSRYSIVFYISANEIRIYIHTRMLCYTIQTHSIPNRTAKKLSI